MNIVVIQIINYTLSFLMWMIVGRGMLTLIIGNRQNIMMLAFVKVTEPVYSVTRKALPFVKGHWIPVVSFFLRHPHACLTRYGGWGLYRPGPTDRASGEGGVHLQLPEFVEWPAHAFPDASAPFVIAVLGDDPFGGALDILKGKTVQGRPVVVQRAASLADMGRVNILFVASSEKSRLGSVLPAAEKVHALTVGDAQGFRSQGGVIQQDGFNFQVKATYRF